MNLKNYKVGLFATKETIEEAVDYVSLMSKQLNADQESTLAAAIMVAALAAALPDMEEILERAMLSMDDIKSENGAWITASTAFYVFLNTLASLQEV